MPLEYHGPSTPIESEGKEVEQLLNEMSSEDEDRPVDAREVTPDHVPSIWNPPGHHGAREY